MKRALLIILASGALALQSLLAERLPNDCAIIATEANARLTGSAVWSQVMKIGYIDIQSTKILGHVLTVWQIHEGGTVFIYDSDGTLDLNTHSQKAKDIAIELNKLYPDKPIFEAKFLQ